MQQVLTRALVLDHTNVTLAYSQPVALNGMNTVQASFIALHFSLGGVPAQVGAQLQQSDDLENWYDVGSPTTIEITGLKRGTAQTGLATAYVRMEFAVTAETGDAILKTVLVTSSR